MSEHRNDNLGVSFRLPEPITMRAHLRYLSATAGEESVLEKLWAGAAAVMQEWSCAALPDPKAIDLDGVSNPAVEGVMIWAAAEVSRVMREIASVPKD